MRISNNSGTDNNSKDFKFFGNNIIIEDGVRFFLPQTISILDDVYIGHDSIVKGSLNNSFLVIGNNSWIGQQCFIYASGGINIGRHVGIAPKVTIFSSFHDLDFGRQSILDSPLIYKPVFIDDYVDIGIGSIIMPGVRVGEGAQIASGSVVNKSVKPYSVVGGNPAIFLRWRKNVK